LTTQNFSSIFLKNFSESVLSEEIVDYQAEQLEALFDVLIIH
jgi:hypothetical protein